MSEASCKKRKQIGVAGSKQKRGRFVSKESTNATIPVGEWGFLVSSESGTERRARQEMVHLLLQAKERLEQQQQESQDKQPTVENPQEAYNGHTTEVSQKKIEKSENGDGKKVDEDKNQAEDATLEEDSNNLKSGEQPVNISQAVEDELKQLKSKEDKLFFYRDISQGMTFLSMKKKEGAPDPVQICHSLLQDIYEKGESKARFSIKLLPVMYSCFASMDEINKLAKKIVEQYFTSDDAQANFSIQYDHRFGPELERMAVIDAFAQLVPSPPYKVDLNNPDVTILVQIVKNSCGVSVVRDWKKFHKYNLREIVRIQNEKINISAR